MSKFAGEETPLSLRALYQRIVQSITTPRSISRFAIIGVVNTAMGIGLFPAMNWLTDNQIEPNILLVISYVICTISAFILHRCFTFQATGSYQQEIVKYVLFSGLTLAVNALLLNVALHFLHLSANIAQVIISTVLSAALMIANYYGLNYFVFKKK